MTGRNILILKYLFIASCNKFKEKKLAEKLKTVSVSFLFFFVFCGALIFLYLREYVLFQRYGDLLFFVLIRTQLIILSSMAFLIHLTFAWRPHTGKISTVLASQLPLTVWNRLWFKMLEFFYESKRFFFLLTYVLVSSFFIVGKITVAAIIGLIISLVIAYIFYAALVLITMAFMNRLTNTLFRQNIIVLTFFWGLIFLFIWFVSMLYQPFAFKTEFLTKYLAFVYYWPSSWTINIVKSIVDNNLNNCIKYGLILFSMTSIVFTILYFLEKRSCFLIEKRYFVPICNDKMSSARWLEKIFGKQKGAFLKKESLSIMRQSFFYIFFAILIVIFVSLGISLSKIVGEELLHAAYIVYICGTICIMTMFLEKLILHPFFKKEIEVIKQLPVSYHNYIFMKLFNSLSVSVLLSGLPILISGIILGFSPSQIFNYIGLVFLLLFVINTLLISLLLIDIHSANIIREFKKGVLLTIFIGSFFMSKIFISYSKIYLIFFPLWLMLGLACLMSSIKKFKKLIIAF